MRVAAVCFGVVVALGCRREAPVIKSDPAPPAPSPSVSASVAKPVDVVVDAEPVQMCKVRMRIAPDAKVKVGLNEVTVVDGILMLRGPVGQQFFVTVESASGKIELVQPVFMTDDGCLPVLIDPKMTAKIVK